MASPSYGSKKQSIRLVTSRHENCRGLSWLCRKYLNNVEWYDKTPVKSTFLQRDMSRGSDYYVVTSINSEVAIHAFLVWILVKYCIIFADVVRYIIIKHFVYETAWSTLFQA